MPTKDDLPAPLDLSKGYDAKVVEAYVAAITKASVAAKALADAQKLVLDSNSSATQSQQKYVEALKGAARVQVEVVQAQRESFQAGKSSAAAYETQVQALNKYKEALAAVGAAQQKAAFEAKSLTEKLKMAGSAIEGVGRELSTLGKGLMDAVKSNVDFKLSLELTSRTMGGTTSAYGDNIKRLKEMRDTLVMTREEFDKFKDVISEAVDIGIDTKDLEAATKKLQSIYGKEEGTKRAGELVQAERNTPGVMRATATGDTAKLKEAERNAESFRERQTIRAAQDAATRGSTEGPKSEDAKFSMDMAKNAKTVDDVKAQVAEIGQKYLGPLVAAQVPAMITLLTGSLFYLRLISTSMKALSVQGMMGGQGGGSLADLADLGDGPGGKKKGKGAKGKAPATRAPRAGATGRMGRAGRLGRLGGVVRGGAALAPAAATAGRGAQVAKGAGTLAKVGGGLAKVGSVAGIAGIAAEIGFGHFEDKAREEGETLKKAGKTKEAGEKEKTANRLGFGAALGGVAGAAGTGALIGGTIGSFIPVIGNAVGAVVGGLLGGAVGLYSERKRLASGAKQLTRDFAGTKVGKGVLDFASSPLGLVLTGPIGYMAAKQVKSWTSEMDRAEKVQEIMRSKTLEAAEALGNAGPVIQEFENQLANAQKNMQKGGPQAAGRAAKAESALSLRGGETIGLGGSLATEVKGQGAALAKFNAASDAGVAKLEAERKKAQAVLAAAPKGAQDARAGMLAAAKRKHSAIAKGGQDDEGYKDARSEEDAYRAKLRAYEAAEAKAKEVLEATQEGIDTARAAKAAMAEQFLEQTSAANIQARIAKAIEIETASLKSKAGVAKTHLDLYGTIGGSGERIVESIKTQAQVVAKEADMLRDSLAEQDNLEKVRIEAAQKSGKDAETIRKMITAIKKETLNVKAAIGQQMEQSFAGLLQSAIGGMQKAIKTVEGSSESMVRMGMTDMLKARQTRMLTQGASPAQQGAMQKEIAGIAEQEASAKEKGQGTANKAIDESADIAIAAERKKAEAASKTAKTDADRLVIANQLAEAEKLVNTHRDVSKLRVLADVEQARTKAIEEGIKAGLAAGDAEKRRLDVKKTQLEAQKGVAEFTGMSFAAQFAIQKEMVATKRVERDITVNQMRAIEAQLGEGAKDDPTYQQKQKDLANQNADLTKSSVGLQRDFLDKALGKAFGTPSGSKFQPAINDRMLFGEHTKAGGLNIQGQIPLEEQRRQMMEAGLGDQLNRPVGKAGVQMGPNGQLQPAVIPGNVPGGAGGAQMPGAAGAGAAGLAAAAQGPGGAGAAAKGVKLPGGLTLEITGKLDINIAPNDKFLVTIDQKITSAVRDMMKNGDVVAGNRAMAPR